MKIDATDQRILNQLQRRGKISNAELAEAANLSASACHRRVQRLEAEGVIKDYVALLDAQIRISNDCLCGNHAVWSGG